MGIVRALPGGKLQAEKAQLERLVEWAYGLRRYQVTGGPDWINSARYDIEATAEGNVGSEQIRLMLQSLLEDRFKLKVHRETRQLPVYDLLLAKGGPKLEPPKEGGCLTPDPNGPSLRPPDESGQLPPPLCGRAEVSIAIKGQGQFEGRVKAGKASMDALASTLSNMLGRTVIDKTGFTQLFDAQMEFAPDDSLAGLPSRFPRSADIPGGPPTIFTAIQEQMGLKLESSKGPVEILVIDSAEKPSEN
jgi:uncharacterized protein (TIGR03435 family)